jgi:hypothetical protein
MGSAEMRKVFENKHSAVSIQPNMKAFATLCRLDSKNGKSRLKLSRLGLLKNMKNGFDRPVDRSVELGLSYCFQQSGYGGWVDG